MPRFEKIRNLKKTEPMVNNNSEPTIEVSTTATLPNDEQKPRRQKLVKGSTEAKEFMAELRSMRKKK